MTNCVDDYSVLTTNKYPGLKQPLIHLYAGGIVKKWFRIDFVY